MNIAALSSQLQRIPDQALAQEMRQPSGAVPQFLILTELQRRQKMRASSSDGDIPASTVAQDVMGSGQQRTPPAGLPAIGAMRAPPTLPTMPVTGMYRGGQVRRFSQGTPDGLVGPGHWLDRQIGRGLGAWASAAGRNLFSADSSFLGGQREAAPVQPLSLSEFSAPPSAPQYNVMDFSAPTPSAARPRHPMNEGPIGATRSGGGGSASTGGDQAAAPKEDGGIMSVFNTFADDPRFAERKTDHSKIEQLMALQQQQGPGLALAKAGFKMAAGTSPFFATNAGEGLAGLSDDLRQQNIDSLKGQLELEGLSAKEAEAEATRRYNMLRLSGDVLTHRDANLTRQEAIKARLQIAKDNELDRGQRAAEALTNRLDSRFYGLYTSEVRTYAEAVNEAHRELVAADAQWAKDHPADAIAGKTSGLTVENMPSWSVAKEAKENLVPIREKMFKISGIDPPARAAADPRGKPGAIRTYDPKGNRVR